MKKLWYRCPICNQKLLKYTEIAVSKEVFIKCKSCRNEVEIKINKNNK